MSGFSSTIALASAGVQAYGSYQGNKDAQKASKYNAAVSRQEAELRRQQGDYLYGKAQDTKRRILARQRALYAKAGVGSSGTPLEVMADTAAEVEMDGLMQKYNAEIGAMQSDSQATRDRQTANAYGRRSLYEPMGLLASNKAVTGWLERNFFTPKPKAR